jgi:SAM-dependent methyltransferase
VENCRSCSSNLEKPFLSLGNAPLSNAFLTENDMQEMEPYYPLEVYVCRNCFLVQIDEFVSARRIFSSDYAYYSSYSESWLQHCKEYAEMTVERFGLKDTSYVIEIGSNDGYLLQYYKQYGIPLLGIEPAANTAEVAIRDGIPTDIAFFNESYARKLGKSSGRADLIIGNNVLAHNPNLNSFVKGLKIALKPEGIITMEFPHLLRLFEGNQFDTIYHEHYSYFSLYAVMRLFERHNLELFDVDEIGTHGGSLRIYAKHKKDKTKMITENVETVLGSEESFGLFDLATYYDFAEKVKRIKRETLKLLINLKDERKKIVGYGAPAKGNTLLNYYGVRTDFLDYTVDRNPQKQGKYLPGTHIPIKDTVEIAGDKPDYIFILPWNIKDEIIEQMKYIRQWGGKFIVPIPEVEVV